MFERFTAEGRQAIVLAQDEARSLGHPRIGSEHLLLGLLREDEALAGRLVSLDDARRGVVELCGFGEEAVEGFIPFTAHAHAALTAAGAARAVGTRELALAVLDLPADATALATLRALGVDAGEARAMVARAVESEVADDDASGITKAARRVLGTAATHADGELVGPEHLMLALVLEAPDLTSRALGVRDGGVVHERLVALLDGPLAGPATPRRDIAALEVALRIAAAEERAVRPADLLLGLIEAAPDVVARAAVDLEAVAQRARRAS